MFDLDPKKAARFILLGKFGTSLCTWLNKHQKGNRLMMETLTGQPYPLKAIRPEDLFASTQGEKGAEGLTFVLELVEKQQRDVMHALRAAIERAPKAPEAPKDFPKSACCNAAINSASSNGTVVERCAECGEPCKIATPEPAEPDEPEPQDTTGPTPDELHEAEEVHGEVGRKVEVETTAGP